MKDEKSKQLGMPFGTACNRLRKLVLFRLLEQSEKDICFRCGKKIEKADDLSMNIREYGFMLILLCFGI